jgi:hypothetical protein
MTHRMHMQMHGADATTAVVQGPKLSVTAPASQQTVGNIGVTNHHHRWVILSEQPAHETARSGSDQQKTHVCIHRYSLLRPAPEACLSLLLVCNGHLLLHPQVVPAAEAAVAAVSAQDAATNNL